MESSINAVFLSFESPQTLIAFSSFYALLNIKFILPFYYKIVNLNINIVAHIIISADIVDFLFLNKFIFDRFTLLLQKQ